MAAQKSPSTRLVMPDPRPAMGGLGVAILGGIMIGTQLTQWRDLGWALIVVGGGMMGWWASQAWRVVQYRREAERLAERQAALKTTRRQKDDEERALRDAEKKTREEQAARLREQRAEEGRRRKEIEDAATRGRADNEARAEAEIARLKAMDGQELRDHVLLLLERKGFLAEPQLDDPDAFVLKRDDAIDGVCRIVRGRMGRASDVREAEAWRRDCGASQGFVVCLHGFAPDGVRAAQGKPVTLVEAHLLAGWLQNMQD